jgi:hypothetical protein
MAWVTESVRAPKHCAVWRASAGQPWYRCRVESQCLQVFTAAGFIAQTIVRTFECDLHSCKTRTTMISMQIRRFGSIPEARVARLEPFA